MKDFYLLFRFQRRNISFLLDTGTDVNQIYTNLRTILGLSLWHVIVKDTIMTLSGLLSMTKNPFLSYTCLNPDRRKQKLECWCRRRPQGLEVHVRVYGIWSSCPSICPSICRPFLHNTRPTSCHHRQSGSTCLFRCGAPFTPSGGFPAVPPCVESLLMQTTTVEKYHTLHS